VINGRFAVAFAAGMVATFNPCGFAMLPAYIGFFLGTDDTAVEHSDAYETVLRALAVTAAVATGFVVVFGLIGMAISWTSIEVRPNLPWVTMVIGLLLTVLGAAMLSGYQPTFALPKLEKGGDRRTLGSMFVFGVSYAIASLSCTIGPFLAVSGILYTSHNWLSGVAIFVVYGLGMAVVLGVLTIAIALTRRSLVHHMRRMVPVIARVSGGLLVLAGGYLAWYGWFEHSGGAQDAGPARPFWNLNAHWASWVEGVGATRLGVLLAGVIIAACVLAWGWHATKRA
jgi:cytochrome c biogenesis protein CcdA